MAPPILYYRNLGTTRNIEIYQIYTYYPMLLITLGSLIHCFKSLCGPPPCASVQQPALPLEEGSFGRIQLFQP